jgi:hypothetical protein
MTSESMNTMYSCVLSASFIIGTLTHVPQRSA